MNLLGEAAPDFSDPLGMLYACHGRMLELCELLERLPAWIDEHGIDDQVDTAVARVNRYFDIAAPLHHADEEADLFPLLDGEAALAPLLRRLRDEHARLEALWQALSTQLSALSAGHCEHVGLRTAVTEFCGAYREHIRIENAELLPAATTLLNAEQTAGLGQAMASRRGLVG